MILTKPQRNLHGIVYLKKQISKCNIQSIPCEQPNQRHWQLQWKCFFCLAVNFDKMQNTVVQHFISDDGFNRLNCTANKGPRDIYDAVHIESEA